MGKYEIQVGIDSGNVYLFDIHRKRRCHTLQLAEHGYAICRLAALEQAAPALTPERVEALRRAIVALEEEQSEYMTTQYPSARDLEIEGAVDVLEKLLKEAEGATDE